MGVQKIFGKNADYQKFEVLKTNRNKRYKYREFLVEGVRNINEAIRNDWQISSFIYSGEKKLSSWAYGLLEKVKTTTNFELTDSLMIDLSKKEETSELLAIVQMKNEKEDMASFSGNPVFALFDRPSNKGNLGTMFRSCDALGVDGLIITGHSVDVYDPDVISSSMGSFFHVPFLRLSDNTEIIRYINDLKNRYPQFNIIGTSERSQTCLQDIDLTTPVLFLIGNETDGLSKYYTEISDVMAAIPMSSNSSASSINVSCAATVMFYEANRQCRRI